MNASHIIGRTIIQLFQKSKQPLQLLNFNYLLPHCTFKRKHGPSDRKSLNLPSPLTLLYSFNQLLLDPSRHNATLFISYLTLSTWTFNCVSHCLSTIAYRWLSTSSFLTFIDANSFILKTYQTSKKSFFQPGFLLP